MNKIKKELRRAFTIVELIVVIAVIAALAAILIPTFMNVVNSANESSDISMIYNINLSLATESDIETPEQALDIAAETGYNIEKLTPSSEGEIVYDEYTNTFALISTEGEVVYPTSNSSLADRLNASTTWYFASSQEDIKSETASYIITGTWEGNVVYNGTGGIDTSRATINGGGVVVGNNTQSQLYAGSGIFASAKITSNSYKVATDANTNNSTKTIVLNITAGYGLYIYPSDSVEYIIYCEAGYNYDSNNSANATFTVKKGEEDPDTNISVSVSTSEGNSSVTFTYCGIDVYKAYTQLVEEAKEAGGESTITLQLGTEKYPYLIDDLSVIGTKISLGILSTYYFTITDNIELSEDITITIDSDDNNVEMDPLTVNIVINGGDKKITSTNSNIVFGTQDNTTIYFGTITVKNLEIDTTNLYVYNVENVNILSCKFSSSNSVFSMHSSKNLCYINVNNSSYSNDGYDITDLNKLVTIDNSEDNSLYLNVDTCTFTGKMDKVFYIKSTTTVTHTILNKVTANMTYTESEDEDYIETLLPTDTDSLSCFIYTTYNTSYGSTVICSDSTFTYKNFGNETYTLLNIVYNVSTVTIMNEKLETGEIS